MAKNRIIDTIFWEDHYTANLDPIEKLLFLYCLTNSSTSICGIYQITLKKMAVETGIEKEMVEKILERFKKDQKIFYLQGWLGIKNFIKHQNQGSPKIKAGIDAELKNVPESVKNLVFDEEKGMDTLSHPNSNINSNSNPNNLPAIAGETVNDAIQLFEQINPSYERLFANRMQRASLERLVKKLTFSGLKKTIGIVEKTNTMPYAPTITTPIELEKSLGKLKAFLQRKSMEKGPVNKYKTKMV